MSITYCPSETCERKDQCKRHLALLSFSDEVKKTKSIINLDRVCPVYKYNLYIKAELSPATITE